MKKVFYPILIATIAGLSTVIGGLVVFLKIKEQNINKFITFCLAFSASIMIGISITDLIPESTHIILSNYNIIPGIIICLITFAIGIFLIRILIKKMSVESRANNLYKLGILSMITLMIHNFPEGIATFMSAYKDIGLGISLGIAIMLHNIPEGISIAVPIYYATGKKSKAIKHTFISGLAEPLGAILAYIFLSNYITNQLIAIILILVAGIMITLAIHEIIPQANKYGEEKWLKRGLILGVVIVLLNYYIL